MTYQETRELLERASDGDQAALRELQLESSRLAKRANVRLSALEKKGFSTQASRRAYAFLDIDDRVKFSESKKLTGDALENQIEELHRFLESGQSTTRDAREYLSGINKLTERGIIEDFDTQSEKNAFLRFLESDYWNDLKLSLGKGRSPTGAKEALQAAQNAIANGAKISDLKKAYQDFKSKESFATQEIGKAMESDIYSVIENWTGEQIF